MQYFVIFTPKQKFGTPEMPSDFPQLLLEEEARAKDLYAGGTSPSIVGAGYEGPWRGRSL